MRALVLAIFLFAVAPISGFAASSDVVLAEVQLASAESGYDEFIELENRGALPVSLAGYSLVKQSSSGRLTRLYAFAETTIPPGGRLVLAHKNSSISGDLRYGSSLALNGALILKKGESVSDALGWGEISAEGEPMPAPPPGKSLSRLGADSDENAADFVVTDPTPGAANVLPQQRAEERISVPTALAITALLPNPERGGEEWLELTNSSDDAADLSGLFVKDLRGRVRSFALTGLLPGRSSRRFTQTETGITLNNDSDGVAVLFGEQSIFETALYSSAPRGAIFRLGAEGWGFEGGAPAKETTSAAPSRAKKSSSPKAKNVSPKTKAAPKKAPAAKQTEAIESSQVPAAVGGTPSWPGTVLLALAGAALGGYSIMAHRKRLGRIGHAIDRYYEKFRRNNEAG